MILLEKITKTFQSVIALKEISLSITEGRITGIIGPDGAGKSTLLEIIAGLQKPDSGKITIDGMTWDRNARQLKKLVGFMPQNFSLYPDLTAEENLRFFAHLYDVPSGLVDRRAEELLEISGLSHARGRLASNLSGGMKQKLMFICCLIHDPELLILDEPTTGVDPVSRAELWNLIRRANQRGTTVILSTSYMDEVEKMDEVVFLHEGKVILQDLPERLRKQFPLKVFEISFAEPEEGEETLKKLPSVRVTFRVGAAVKVYAEKDIDERKLIENLSPVAIDIKPVPPAAEDIFIYMTGGFPDE